MIVARCDKCKREWSVCFDSNVMGWSIEIDGKKTPISDVLSDVDVITGRSRSGFGSTHICRENCLSDILKGLGVTLNK